MRFITEFELEYPYNLFEIENMKISLQEGFGNKIAESFQWKEIGTATIKGPVKYKASIEIEAFPMDKWIEFKQKLLMECGMPEPNGVAILEMIKDLEFYTNNKQAVDVLIGKPSGDAITNLPDRIEYRGPDSHCKACEDEKNGVKHVMAQKHTCRK